MILEFKVENYRSFKTEQILSFEATSDNNLEEYYINRIGKHRLLKTAMLYGANASGKTNLLLALDFLRKIILTPRIDKSEETGHIPFLFDENCKKRPGNFEITFFMNDIKYNYKIELDKNIIYNEELSYYLTSRPALIYKRTYNEERNISVLKKGSKINLSKNEHFKLEANLINNTSVLAAYDRTNVEFKELEIITDYFKNGLLPIIKTDTDLFHYAYNKLEKNQNKKYKDFIIDLLHKADLNIDNIEAEKEKIIIDEKLHEMIKTSPLPGELKEEVLNKENLEANQLYFNHIINDSGSDERIPYYLESAGTLRMFEIAAPLYELIYNRFLLTIDEIERSLHPDLIIFIFELFLQNSNYSQLVFTTQNLSLLEERDILRKDTIWFAEKDKSGATELYSLSDFDIRKELSYINAYKAGKFGATPILGSTFLDK